MANSVTADGVINALFQYAELRERVNAVSMATNRGSNLTLFDELCNAETHLLSLTEQYRRSQMGHQATRRRKVQKEQ